MDDAQVGWIGAIIIGGVAGWLAEQFMKSEMGILMNIVLGIIGAAVASAILSFFGVHLGGWLGYLIAGFIGAVLLIWIARADTGDAPASLRATSRSQIKFSSPMRYKSRPYRQRPPEAGCTSLRGASAAMGLTAVSQQSRWWIKEATAMVKRRWPRSGCSVGELGFGEGCCPIDPTESSNDRRI